MKKRETIKRENGKGSYTWPNGNVDVGEISYEDDKRHEKRQNENKTRGAGREGKN